MKAVLAKSLQFLETLNNIDPNIPDAKFRGTFDGKNLVVELRCKRGLETLSGMSVITSKCLSESSNAANLAIFVAERLKNSAMRELEARELEIIGNIWENPELKGESDGA